MTCTVIYYHSHKLQKNYKYKKAKMLENIRIWKNGNIQIYMQKNINVENVKEYVAKENIYIYKNIKAK